MNRKVPMVSVVIPSYNRGFSISRAIQSVLTQHYQNFEIIIVDDCSTDNTKELVERFSDSRIKYIKHDHNLGAGASRNTGIRASSGKYVAFLDSDDEWLPEKLEKQVRLFQRSDIDVGVIYTWSSEIEGNNRVIRSHKDEYRGYISDKLLYLNYLGSASVFIVKRQCFEKVGEFETNMDFCEDWDMLIRLARSYKFDVVPEVLVRIHNYDDNNKLTIPKKETVDSTIKFFRKYHRDLISNKMFKRQDAISNKEKSRFFFKRGRNFVSRGYSVSHQESIRVGRKYFLAAFEIRPFEIGYLLHYVLSWFGRSIYLQFITVENVGYKLYKLIFP